MQSIQRYGTWLPWLWISWSLFSGDNLCVNYNTAILWHILFIFRRLWRNTYISAFMMIQCFSLILHTDSVKSIYFSTHEMSVLSSKCMRSWMNLLYLEKFEQIVGGATLCYHRYNHNQRCCGEHSLTRFRNRISNSQCKWHCTP